MKFRIEKNSRSEGKATGPVQVPAPTSLQLSTFLQQNTAGGAGGKRCRRGSAVYVMCDTVSRDAFLFQASKILHYEVSGDRH